MSRAGATGSLWQPTNEPWAAWYQILYPPPAGPIAPFAAYKRATNGVHTVEDLWAEFTSARARRGAGGHQPYVLHRPVGAYWACCLGCAWLGADVHPNGQVALERAMEHRGHPDQQTSGEPAVGSMLARWRVR